MKKRITIISNAYLLLLIYIFSLSLGTLFHHHTNNIVSVNHANACESKILYKEADVKCSHKSHVAKSKEKCTLCEHQLVVEHFFDTYFHPFFKDSFRLRFLTIDIHCIPSSISSITNKGPPVI